MPNLLAMSFEGRLAPSIELRCLEPGRRPPDGWGLGFYPGGEWSAVVQKEAAHQQGGMGAELVRSWQHLETSLSVLHIRRAHWGSATYANTQPFRSSLGGSDWLFAHAGSLNHRFEAQPGRTFEPVGSTDTEQIFCEILNRCVDRGWRSIGDTDVVELARWFRELGEHGGMTTVLTDGNDLVAYADHKGEGELYMWQLMPPYDEVIFGDDDVVVNLTRRGVQNLKGVILSSGHFRAEPGSSVTPAWTRVDAGKLLVVREGAIRHEIADTGGAVQSNLVPMRNPVRRPSRAPIKRMSVRHFTSYDYATPVERSTHLLRLTPVEDHVQRLVEHHVRVSVDGETREYADVFGNRCHRVLIEQPYTRLEVEATSLVDVKDTDPLQFDPVHARSSIPLVWMPWQRHMLDPYLLPPELPETQLRELSDYAMSFVRRNDFNLIDMLIDLNSTIFTDYQYQQGSTSLATTAFEVFVNRRGVCQDFTNLFICMTRLLGLPSRYVCGYIYTGPKNPNQIQSEASHAWVQVFLPEHGWMGFDPTNGILTQTDHVRVAVGRNYRDATPTSGTIYVGGGHETLTVDVKVEQIEWAVSGSFPPPPPGQSQSQVASG